MSEPPPQASWPAQPPWPAPYPPPYAGWGPVPWQQTPPAAVVGPPRPPRVRRPPDPPAPRRLPALVLIAGILAAVAMPGRAPGVGLLVGAIGVGAAVIATLTVSGRPRLRPWPAAFGCLAYALVATAALRAAPWVAALTVLAALAFGSVAVSGAAGWLGLLRGAVAALVAAAPAVRWVLRAVRFHGPSWTASRPALRGAAVAVVLLGVFGMLFGTADAAFADLAGRAVPQLTLGRWPMRLIVGAGAACFAAAATLVATRSPVDPAGAGRPAQRRRVEWVLPLAALDLLFAAFVGVQLTVLFAGNDHVLRTTGLTYAQYARQGFWQLLVAAALTLAVVGLTARLVSRRDRRDRLLLRILLGCLCGLTIVVLASAVRRLGLYEQAYGLTRLRVSAQGIAYWLAAVFVLIMVAGAFRQAAWLPRAALATAGLALVGFALSNPDGRIAASAVHQAQRGHPVDIGYLSALSPDAIPALQQLPDRHERDCLLAVLAGRLPEPGGWADANLGRSQARRSLAAHPVSQVVECR
ncbi:MAG: DUF4173 domain-containing protein [Actinomycetota bacterium]|nr:DUF4173 domain-containing protein [Actinomycetota bacterium]